MFTAIHSCAVKYLVSGLWAVLLFILCTPALGVAQSWQWATVPLLSGTGHSLCPAVAVDAAGNTVVAGTFSGTITLGSFTLSTGSASNSDIFVARLSPAGTWTQALRAGGTDYDYATALAVAPNGDVVVAGYFRSPTVVLGSTTLTNASTAAGTDDIFVARLSPAGTWIQAVQAGGPQSDGVHDLAIAPNGDVVVAGDFEATARFGSFALTTSSPGGGNEDIFVARLNPAGTWTQAVGVGSAGLDAPAGLAVAANGDVVLAGNFQGPSIEFGSTTLTSAGAMDIFVARLSPGGTWVQCSRGGGGATDTVAGMGLDGVGNAVILGTSSGASTWGSIGLANAGTYVARLSPAGSWTQALELGAGKLPDKVAVGAAGQVTVAGHFYTSSISFGATTLTNRHQGGPGTFSADLFVAQLSAAGSWLGVIDAGGTVEDVPQALALASNGTAVVAGTLYSRPAAFGPISVNHGGTSSSAFFVARFGGLVSASILPRLAERFALAPNPATASVRLTWPVAAAVPRPVQFLDNRGREVRRQVLPARATDALLDVAGLAPGLYLLRCGAAVGRLVVE